MNLRHCFLATLALAAAAGDARAQIRTEYGHLAASDIAVMLNGNFAKVKVTGWSRDSIVVASDLPKGSRLEPMFGGDAATPARGVKMFVEAANKMAAPGGTVEIRLPINARITIVSATADIDVSGLLGQVKVNMAGGTIRVSGNPKTLQVEGIDAAITVDGTPEWMRLTTAEGDITVRGGSPDAGFNTVTGNIRVTDGALERAKFETTSGTVTFIGELVRGSAVNIDTHSGAIDLQFGPKASATVEAVSTNGTIENFWHKQQPTTSRDGRGQEINMQMGNGEGRVVIRTYKGTVRIAKKL
jgi:DUF4097 and DUF4098 domain-containing protein YvlB